MEQRYDVTGMTCSACSAAVEKAVKKVPGVSRVNVSLMTNTMSVLLDDGIQETEVIEAVKKAGYSAAVHTK